MKEEANKLHKFTAVLAVLFPILYGVMYLPIWNFYIYDTPIEMFTKISLPEFIFQGFCLLIAVIRAAGIFCWKKSRFNFAFGFIFYPLIFLSGTLVLFNGIFFVNGLLGIPPFPPQS